jgi:hypothetical protein
VKKGEHLLPVFAAGIFGVSFLQYIFYPMVHFYFSVDSNTDCLDNILIIA